MPTVLVVTGPSGAGKGTLIRELVERVPGIEVTVSATTRERRRGEENGREYWFLSDAEFLAGVAAREGAELHVIDRGRHAVAYAKGTEPIADALVAAGASDVVLVLEERSVVAATRADANRLANADHANLVRTSRAAHAQLEALGKLDLDALPDDLRELATLRLRHPTLSIAELARRCRPPASKAAAYRRLRRIQALAGD